MSIWISSRQRSTTSSSPVTLLAVSVSLTCFLPLSLLVGPLILSLRGARPKSAPGPSHVVHARSRRGRGVIGHP
ncbi:hypothetical protein GCM10010384_13150 [Streptomyces djakartensis]|uniref:Uncharacterized protein n=1 Tax=Streptomyces djakartensis TaxID=68193 RepID=A0ABQ2Z9Y2_9ACTN|nr:hypothetical protein GCM10010384_13150 [Streptomyces djakartensis]